MHTSFIGLKVMSEIVASALQMIDEENTRATYLFIRMIDMCFYALNVKKQNGRTA